MELSVQWDAEELESYLLEIGVNEDVVGNIIGNRITGALFLQLSENYFKELAPRQDRPEKSFRTSPQSKYLAPSEYQFSNESTRFLPHMQVEEPPPTNSHTEGASQCRISTDPNSHALPESGYRSCLLCNSL